MRKNTQFTPIFSQKNLSCVCMWRGRFRKSCDSLQVFVKFDLESNKSVTEFKEFERRFKFKPRFKYGWFHVKLYQMFNLNRVLADLNRGSNSLNSISDCKVIWFGKCEVAARIQLIFPFLFYRRMHFQWKRCEKTTLKRNWVFSNLYNVIVQILNISNLDYLIQ